MLTLGLTALVLTSQACHMADDTVPVELQMALMEANDDAGSRGMDMMMMMESMDGTILAEEDTEEDIVAAERAHIFAFARAIDSLFEHVSNVAPTWVEIAVPRAAHPCEREIQATGCANEFCLKQHPEVIGELCAMLLLERNNEPTFSVQALQPIQRMAIVREIDVHADGEHLPLSPAGARPRFEDEPPPACFPIYLLGVVACLLIMRARAARGSGGAQEEVLTVEPLHIKSASSPDAVPLSKGRRESPKDVSEIKML